MINNIQYLPHSAVNIINTYLPDFCPLNELLFFDIETTGLYWKNSIVYLIGIICYQNNEWISVQYFAEYPDEEKELLDSFLTITKTKTHFIQYNGRSFDIPYLQHKFAQYKQSNCFENQTYIDLYQIFAPLKKILKLENLKQKTLEAYLCCPRKDQKQGKELISLYKKYVTCPDPTKLDLLLLHNSDDITGMVYLLQLYAYLSLFKGNFTVSHAKLLPLPDCPGYSKQQDRQELVLTLDTDSILCRQFSYMQDELYITGHASKIKLKTILTGGTLKLYYSDYKNYYYLPMEDNAIHKSVGIYVDPEHRVQATAATCYQNIPLNSELLSNTDALRLYAKSAIKYLLSVY